MAKEVMLMPPAELSEHAGDVDLTNDQFLKLSFFQLLKRKPGIEKYPGALRLRRFRAGETICRQGETGWTAFFPLKSEDVRDVLKDLLTQTPAGRERSALERQLADVETRLQQSAGEAATHPLRAVATVQVRLARPSAPRTTGGLSQFVRRLFGASPPAQPRAARFIPIDGSSGGVPYDTRQATMYEGDVFGEMSCIYGFPRSATVVCQRDWYILEMLRNIFDQASKDEKFEERMDEVYRERVLQNHLRGLPIFADLTEEEYAAIRDRLELVRLGDGDIICDQNERPRHMYIVRSGMVKVVRNSSALLGAPDVKNWTTFGEQLLKAAQTPGGAQVVWQKLPEPVRQAIEQAGGAEKVGNDVQQELLYSLNDMLMDPAFHRQPAFAEHLPSAVARAGAKSDAKKWTPQESRQVQRQLLGLLFPDVLRSRNPSSEYIAAYCSRGEFLGEIGLLTGLPVSATCSAYVHPAPDDPAQAGVWRREAKQIELVRITGDVFRHLVSSVPSIRQKFEVVAAERQKQDARRVRTPTWSDALEGHYSAEFEELGLIQGQKLMLISLDRCTRCDECVNACIDTHHDGRSRLFLDGPRFGNYLVPTTCRSCCDPVCMIGCPVGSIHRGNNGQIVIEDWCIGCNLCAKNCPYGAIQMHDIGLIPNGAIGWRVALASNVDAQKWMRPDHADRNWLAERAPFIFDETLKSQLGLHAAPNAGLCFRYHFRPSLDVLRGADDFCLEITSVDDAARIWLNGQELQAQGAAKRGKREFAVPRPQVKAGDNLLAVMVVPRQKPLELLLDVRLDEIHQPEAPTGASGAFSEKPVQARAVVCDLCSNQFGQKPACVTACPHDAAMRVNARFEFPNR